MSRRIGELCLFARGLVHKFFDLPFHFLGSCIQVCKVSVHLWYIKFTNIHTLMAITLHLDFGKLPQFLMLVFIDHRFTWIITCKRRIFYITFSWHVLMLAIVLFMLNWMSYGIALCIVFILNMSIMSRYMFSCRIEYRGVWGCSFQGGVEIVS